MRKYNLPSVTRQESDAPMTFQAQTNSSGFGSMQLARQPLGTQYIVQHHPT